MLEFLFFKKKNAIRILKGTVFHLEIDFSALDMADQNHNELSPHTCENGNSEIRQDTGVGEHVERGEPVHCW